MRAIFMVLIATCSLIMAYQQYRIDSVTDILPKLHICNRYDYYIESCIEENINLMSYYLFHGVPELNIPPIDPYYINHYMLTPTGREFNVTGNITDIIIYGLTTFNISNLTIISDARHMKFDIHFPYIEMSAHFDINATRLALLRRNGGTGKMIGDYRNVTAHVDINGKLYEKNGLTYYRADNVSVNLFVENPRTIFKYRNYYPPVSNSLKEYINTRENWELISSEILPKVEIIASDFIKTITNNFYSKFPIDKLMSYY